MTCRKGLNLAVSSVALLVLLGSTAWAQDRVSGVITRTYVIVEDTDLIGDIVCDVTGAPCFSFGAANVELRLNGFTMTGKADPVTACGGAVTAGEFAITTSGMAGVVVRGPGLVQRFRNHAIVVAGSTNARIESLTTSTHCGSGVFVNGTSFGTLVQRVIAVRNGTSAPGFPCGGI